MTGTEEYLVLCIFRSVISRAMPMHPMTRPGEDRGMARMAIFVDALRLAYSTGKAPRSAKKVS